MPAGRPIDPGGGPARRRRQERELYQIEAGGAPVAPPLPGEVATAATADELIDRLAADLVVQAEESVRRCGDFHVALSGGADLELLYERLMYDPNSRRLPWGATHLYFVDEPCVGRDDPRSAVGQIGQTIGDHADIPPAQVHAIDPAVEGADLAYERRIKGLLGGRRPGSQRLDFVLLLLGRDGRVGGLVPGSAALRESRRLVVMAREEDPPRLTMTLNLINDARFVAIFATGSACAEVVRRCAARRAERAAMPVAGVAPADGVLRWYLDGSACDAEGGW